MKKSIRLITILLAILSAFVFISCDQASVEDLFDDGRGDNPDPGPMSGLVAPSWLVSKSPSAAGAADGIIYGVTPYMEYSYGRSNSWTQCPGGKIEGLSAGNVFVRYAETQSRLAGEAVLVCMDDVSTYDGTPKLLSAEELADYNVLVVNENTGEVEIKKADTLGSYPDVYLIESAKAWNTVATDESTYNGKVLILGDNLDFTGLDCSMMNYPFTGKIYGNGYLIENFAGSPGLIKNTGNNLYLNYIQLTKSTCSLIGTINAGSNVAVIGCSIFNGSITSNSSVGGIVRTLQNGQKITLIMSHTKVLNSTILCTGKEEGVGILIGRSDAGGHSIELNNCMATDCWLASFKNVGGLIGYTASPFTASHCIVKDCTIIAENISAGGLVGRVKTETGVISHCEVSHCNIAGTQNVGGLAGFFMYSSMDNCEAINCNVVGTEGVGSLVGSAWGDSRTTVGQSVALCCNVEGSSSAKTGGVLGQGVGTFVNCIAGKSGKEVYVSPRSGNDVNGTAVTATMSDCSASIVDTPFDLTFPTEEEIAVFPESKLPYVYVTYKTARGSMGAPYSDGKMTVSIPYLRSAPFGSSASGNIPKPLDASTDWLMANGKVRNTDPVVSEEVVIADLLN